MTRVPGEVPYSNSQTHCMDLPLCFLNSSFPWVVRYDWGRVGTKAFHLIHRLYLTYHSQLPLRPATHPRKIPGVTSPESGFHGFLRGNECATFRSSDFCFHGDPRLSEFQNISAGCVVRDEITGNSQLLSISHPVLLCSLDRFIRPMYQNSGYLLHISY